jgi:hypothetical protein
MGDQYREQWGAETVSVIDYRNSDIGLIIQRMHLMTGIPLVQKG